MRRAYQAEFGAFLAEMKKGCQMMDIDYVPLRTDQELDVALSGYLASRALRSDKRDDGQYCRKEISIRIGLVPNSISGRAWRPRASRTLYD